MLPGEEEGRGMKAMSVEFGTENVQFLFRRQDYMYDAVWSFGLSRERAFAMGMLISHDWEY